MYILLLLYIYRGLEYATIVIRCIVLLFVVEPRKRNILSNVYKVNYCKHNHIVRIIFVPFACIRREFSQFSVFITVVSSVWHGVRKRARFSFLTDFWIETTKCEQRTNVFRTNAQPRLVYFSILNIARPATIDFRTKPIADFVHQATTVRAVNRRDQIRDLIYWQNGLSRRFLTNQRRCSTTVAAVTCLATIPYAPHLRHITSKLMVFFDIGDIRPLILVKL